MWREFVWVLYKIRQQKVCRIGISPFLVMNHHTTSQNDDLLSRYLFNCGDGTQRLCMENKVKLSKLSGIFFSSLSPKKIGGFPGICSALLWSNQDYRVVFRNVADHLFDGLEILGDLWSSRSMWLYLLIKAICHPVYHIYSCEFQIIRPDMTLIVRELYNDRYVFEDKENNFFVQPLVIKDTPLHGTQSFLQKRNSRLLYQAIA